ncbi:MAG: MMPL family transporter [SAR324 cluster bacterium]|nr:MMPL family transporter [SAR324 cluster bacterium]
MEQLTQRIPQEVPGVMSVVSLTNTPQLEGTCAGKSYLYYEEASLCVNILERYRMNQQCAGKPDSVQADSNGSATTDFLEASPVMIGDSFSEPPVTTDFLEASPVLLGDAITESPITTDFLEASPVMIGDSFSEPPVTTDFLEASPVLLDESLSSAVDSAVVAVEQPHVECVPGLFKNPDDFKQEMDRRAKQAYEALKGNSLILKDLISSDFKTASMLVQFGNEIPPESKKVQIAMENLLAEYQAKGYRLAYAGQSRQQYQASKVLAGDIVRILPLSLLLMVGSLALSFRSARGVLIPLTVIALGMIWTFGIFSIVGENLNPVTMVLPPLLICVGSAYVIFTVNQFYQEIKAGHNTDRRSLLDHTVAHVTVPLFVTALTTVAGFAALIASPIPAIKSMGLYACIGVVIIIALSLTLVPALLSLMNIPVYKERDLKPGKLDKVLNFMAHFVGNYPKHLLAMWIGIGALGLVGVTWIEVNSEGGAFPADTPIMQDLKLIEDQLAGTNSLRLVFQNDADPHQLKTAAMMRKLDVLKHMLMEPDPESPILKIDGLRIDKVYTLTEYLKLRYPDFDELTDRGVERFIEQLRANKGPKFISDNNELLQLTVRLQTSGSTAFLQLRSHLEKVLPEMFPGFTIRYTGGGVLASESADNIARSQVSSMILALTIIFVILSAMFMSVKMGVLALYPNIVPILVFFGVLGWLSIPLGVTISVIAAIALGIGVDDTIHYLAHFNENVKKMRNEREASLFTLRQVGRPATYTTVSLCLGFGVFMMSEMETQVLFGALVCFTLLVCWMADMNFTPAITTKTKIITAWDYVGMQLDEAFLKTLDIFQGMSLKEIKLATLSAYTIDLEPGKLLFREKDSGYEAYVIIKGKIQLYREAEFHGTQKIVSEHVPGETLGVRGLFRKSKRTTSAVALENTQVLVLNDDILKKLMGRYPDVATRLFKNFATTLARPIQNAERQVAFKYAQMLGEFEGDPEAYVTFLTEIVDRIVADGSMSPQEKQEIETIVYADGKVTPEEQTQLDRLNALIDSGELVEEESLEDLVNAIIADGEISPEERKALNKAIYADHNVSAEEQAQIDRLNQMIQDGKVIEHKPAFESIFQQMTPREIRWLRHTFEIKHIPQGMRVYSEGDFGDYMLIVMNGKFNIHVKEKGQDYTIATIFEGDVIGAVSIILKDYIRSHSASVLEEAEVMFMSLKGLDRLEKTHRKLASKFYFNMVCMFSDRLEECLDQLQG